VAEPHRPVTEKKKRVIDGTLLALVAILVGLAALAWSRGGSAMVSEGLGTGWNLLLRFGPVIVVSFLAAGFADLLLPTEWVRAQLGADSGMRGIALATGAGILTPAGPFVSLPIAAVMIRTGAGTGPVVAFLSAWSLLAVHRFLAWEVPILGWRFAILRYATCALLPIVAGLLARALTRSS
jgi:uncharacterized membrane protein YraQ (UPF0718 family)